MMRRKLGIATVLILALAFAGVAHAEDGQEKFDAAMQPILKEYLKITATLAADKTDGVADAAKAIATMGTALDASKVEPAHAKHYQSIAQNLPAAATKLAQAADIAAMRKSLVDLSKPMVLWAEHQEKKSATVVFCPMFPGSWLQEGTAVRNPYYGAKMLTCGEIVGAKKSDTKKDEHHHH